MQKFDMKNPSDRAKLLPGYYWATNYSYYNTPVIVTVYFWNNKRTITTGNEYTEHTLEVLIKDAEEYSGKYSIFFGPIEFPEEFKV
jgi:hypothetical protein